MKNKIKLVFVITVVTFLYSCQDFIEKDLDKKAITVLAPANNTTSSSFTQLFWWESVKGADQYNLQIVKPNFVAIQSLILDTTIKGTQFPFVLQPGVYQWRVRAMNSSSHTEYVTYKITIDSTLDLSKQAVVLTSPANNSYTKNINTSTTFTWQTVPNATSYLFQVVSSTNSIISTQTPTTTTASYTVTAEGKYTWRVLAQNSNSSTLFSTNTFTVDTTKPAVTSPVSPLTDTITGNPIVLKWNNVTDADFYHIQVSTDSTFATVLTDTTTTGVTYNLYNTITNKYYYWRVKTMDKASNESAYFTRRRIKRN